MVASRRKKFCATETTLTIFLLILLRQKVGSKLPEANERVVEDDAHNMNDQDKKKSHIQTIAKEKRTDLQRKKDVALL
jgi:hypothetical protein